MSIIEIVTLVIAVTGAFFSTPWGSGWAASYANHLRQVRALARIKGFGRIKEGAFILFYTDDAGAGPALLGEEGDPWYIESLGVRVELSRLGWNGFQQYLQLTAAEFEAGVAIVQEEVD